MHPCVYCLLGFETLKKIRVSKPRRSGLWLGWTATRTWDDDFDGLIRHSGLAGSYDYDDISESYGYIRDVYKIILTRDLVQKFSLPDSTVLERLSEYMVDNSGNLNSPTY